MKSSIAIVLVFILYNQALWIDGASNALDTTLFKNLNESLDADKPVRYDGAQLWNVDFNDDRTKNIVVELKRTYDFSIWGTNGSAIDVFVKKSQVDEVGQRLNEANIPYNVVVQDYQKAIEQENPPQEEIELLQNRNGHRLTWAAYHRLADIHSYLDYLVATYPDLCSLQTIGYSVERRPLKVIKVSNGNPHNKAIWIDGGIHAREWISPASVTYILNDLVENWEDQPQYVQNTNWYILPVLNPDGYEHTHVSDRLWRKNRSKPYGFACAGVDLNRNYGYKWGGKGTSRNPCSEIYIGRSAFSEPESLAQRQFFDRTKEKFDAFLTFHSYGQYILHPWGYDHVVPPDHQDLTRVGNDAARSMYAIDKHTYKVGPSGDLLYPAAGASDDWAKSIGIKYSYTIELRDSGRYGFVLPAMFILDTAKEAQAFALTIARNVANDRRKP